MARERKRGWVEKVVESLTIAALIPPLVFILVILTPLMMVCGVARAWRKSPEDEALAEGSQILRRFCKERERDGSTKS